jgi:hypothetical protein
MRISARQLIEYVAFGWEPFESEKEEILSGRNRKLELQKINDVIFLLKNAVSKIEAYILDSKSNFIIYAYEEDDYINIPELEKKLKNKEISRDEYLQYFQYRNLSEVAIENKFFSDEYPVKKQIRYQDYWDDFFDFIYCDDVELYFDPYHYYKNKEIDLFYIKTRNGFDIRYYDLEFEFEDIDEIVRKNKLEDLSNNGIITDKRVKRERVRELAKEIKKETPDITNNACANLIKKKLNEKDGVYPSIGTIINLISDIAPQDKRGKNNK